MKVIPETCFYRTWKKSVFIFIFSPIDTYIDWNDISFIIPLLNISCFIGNLEHTWLKNKIELWWVNLTASPTDGMMLQLWYVQTMKEWKFQSTDNFDREKYWITDNLDRVKYCVRRQLWQREVLSHWQPWQSKVFCSLTTLTEWNIDFTDNFDRVRYWVHWQPWQCEVFSPLKTLTVWNIEWTDSFDRVKYLVHLQHWQCEILSQLTALTEWTIEWTDNFDRVKYWVNWQHCRVWNIESTDSFDRVKYCVNWQLWQSEILSELTTLPGVKYLVNWQLWRIEILSELKTLTEWNIESTDNWYLCVVAYRHDAMMNKNAAIEINFLFLLNWIKDFTYVKWYYHLSIWLACVQSQHLYDIRL